jgi:hypothetical protein
MAVVIVVAVRSYIKTTKIRITIVVVALFFSLIVFVFDNFTYRLKQPIASLSLQTVFVSLPETYSSISSEYATMRKQKLRKQTKSKT